MWTPNVTVKPEILKITIATHIISYNKTAYFNFHSTQLFLGVF